MARAGASELRPLLRLASSVQIQRPDEPAHEGAGRIGVGVEVHEMSEKLILQAIDWLRR